MTRKTDRLRILLTPRQVDKGAAEPGQAGPAAVLIGLPRTIRRHELHVIVPLSDTTIYDMESRGEFPQRFYLTPRSVIWVPQ